MFVRTKEGKILKCFKSESMNLPIYYVIGSKTNSYVEYQDVKKVSKNIIDILEVGDYVNGYPVIEIPYMEENKIVYKLYYKNNFLLCTENHKIKSIVTKEQFSQMEYKVGEENE